jgi:hypothetical protein
MLTEWILICADDEIESTNAPRKNKLVEQGRRFTGIHPERHSRYRLIL